MPGPFAILVSSGSVPGDDRATPVEAIDQLGADRIDRRLPALGDAEGRANRRTAARRDAHASRNDVLALEVGSARLGLPEQAGQEVDRVFNTAAEEEAIEGLRIKLNTGGGASDKIQTHRVVVRLCEAAAEIGQQRRGDQIADTCACTPGPGLFHRA